MPTRDLAPEQGLHALLGPTNTGKTHRAIQRLLAHRSGMIGLPLRLLAQEVYDRVCAVAGEAQVALVTGEQKRVPPKARYWVCTVEAMPVDRPVSFLAVDEVQLAGSRARGHVFTDRLLHARGVNETLLLGSDTIEPLLRRLLPHAAISRLPRLSTLRYAGARKLAALPARSAVVAFSAEQVYAIAERIRRRHGGAAVVLGALSPRARNAQVALFQRGEVQYMVATDAIGLGLNMDLHHVAFAELRKFDGHRARDLEPAELAQIAGRAGRYQRDGTFGTLDPEGELPPEQVAAVESHQLPALERLYWRNSALAFDSVPALLDSLERPSPRPYLVQVRDAEDHQALRALAQDPTLAPLLRGPDAVRALWEVCQVPDFRKTLTDSHVQLLRSLALHLLGPAGTLPEAWVERSITRLDSDQGDLDTLLTRMAWIRTWNYISARPGWVEDAPRWQARCLQIEDRLSDALHEQLTRRFVEGRGGFRIEGLHAGPAPQDAAVLGRLAGLRFTGAPGAPLRGEARALVLGELAQRLARLQAGDDRALLVDEHARVCWEGGVLAVLAPGRTPLEPELRLCRLELLEPEQREAVRRHLEAWLRRWLAPLRVPEDPRVDALSPPWRGALWQLHEALGTLPRERAPRRLNPEDRRLLGALDLRVGAHFVYQAALLRPPVLRTRALLWAVHAGWGSRAGEPVARPLPLPDPAPGAPRDPALPEGWYLATGAVPLGQRVLRVDALERLAARLAGLASGPPRPLPADLGAELGGGPEDLRAAAERLGFGGLWEAPLASGRRGAGR